MYRYYELGTKSLNYGVNKKCVLIGSKSDTQLLFKSKGGEDKNLQKVLKNGTLHEREVLAYRLDRDVFKWGIVPVTRELWFSGDIGSAQRFIAHGTHESFYDLCKYKRFTKIIIFDYLLNHGDRHTDNLITGKDNKLWAIDNGNICPNSMGDADKSISNMYYLINEHIKYVHKLLNLVDIKNLCKYIPYTIARAKTEERYNSLLSNISKYKTWNDVIKNIQK